MNTVEVFLKCGHVHRRAKLKEIPTLGEMRYCLFHGNQPIGKIGFHEWRVKCFAPACRFGRWCGQDESKAKRDRRNHVRNHPAHAAWVSGIVYDKVTQDGKGTIARLDKAKRRGKLEPEQQELLPVDIGPPPF